MITLDSYLEDNSIDLVDSILTDPDGNAYSYSEKAGKAIWAMYRYALMNCMPAEKYINRWIQRGRDIAYNLDERYSQLFTAYESLKTAGKPVSIDITDTGTTTTETEGSSTGTSENTDTSEAIPQYADASQGTWLTGRGKSSGSNSGTSTGKATVTENRSSTGGSLPVELMQRMRNGLFNPYLEYAGEFENLFVPFYIDESGCDCI